MARMKIAWSHSWVDGHGQKTDFYMKPQSWNSNNQQGRYYKNKKRVVCGSCGRHGHCARDCRNPRCSQSQPNLYRGDETLQTTRRHRHTPLQHRDTIPTKIKIEHREATEEKKQKQNQWEMQSQNNNPIHIIFQMTKIFQTYFKGLLTRFMQTLSLAMAWFVRHLFIDISTVAFSIYFAETRRR